ncbi:MAG: type II toxin-antitoxin system VapC family toxin [Rhodospirillaceae bacterium]|nr:MAG: type II toxin-antitoxin system VapC family toxin [Rhodospirillaceae bacterium]
MKVVDSCGWIDVWAAGPHVAIYAPLLQDPNDILIPSIVICEVYKWMLRERGLSKAATVLAEMRKSKVVTLDVGIAVSAAALCRQYSMATADAIVYATAIQENTVLVTSDKIFDGLPGVIYHNKIGQPTVRKI